MRDLDLTTEEMAALNEYALMNGIRGDDWQDSLRSDWKHWTGCYRGMGNSPHCRILDRLHWTHGEHILARYKASIRELLSGLKR